MAAEDAMFLLEMIAVTEMETLSTKEDNEYEYILCEFAAGYQHFTGTSARLQVCEAEESARFSLKIEENCERNALHVKSRLSFHGASKETLNTFVPLPDEDSLPPDESWRQLPQMVPQDEVQSPTKSSKELQAALSAADPTNSDYLSQIEVQKIQQRENWAREDITKEEASRHERLKKQFHKFLDQLRQLEVDLLQEHDARIMSRMAPDERQRYIVWPAVKSELHERERVMLEQASDFRYLCLRCLEGLLFGSAKERFVARFVELEAAKKERQLMELGVIAFKSLGGRYLTDWLRFTKRSTLIARGTKEVGALSLLRRHDLLLRYVAKWNHTPQSRRIREEQTNLLSEQATVYVHLECSEGEERGRNTIALDQAFNMSMLAEQYFLEKEAAEKVWQRRLADELIVRSERRHQLRRLVTWYKKWKHASMIRKSRWLLGSVYGGTMKNYFSLWLLFLQQRNSNRHARWTLLTDAKREKQEVFLIDSEELQRSVIALEEDLTAQSMVNSLSQHYIGAKQRYNERLVAVLATDRSCVQRQYRFHLWMAFAQVSKAQKLAAQFMSSNDHTMRAMYFEKWSKWTSKRSRKDLLLLELHGQIRSLLVVEYEEGFDRLTLLQREDWSRVRRDFRFANALGSNSRMQVANAMSAFSGRLSETTLELRWNTWMRFLKHRRHIRQATLVVEHMEYECELTMMQRYFEKMSNYVQYIQHKRRVEAAAIVFEEGLISLEQDIETQRSMLEEEEQWGFTRIQLAHGRSIKTLRSAYQKEIVRAMSSFNGVGLMRVFYYKLLRNVTQRKRIRELTAIVAQREASLLFQRQQQFFARWRKFWWYALRPKVAEDLCQRHNRKLLRRYFRNFAPTAVRAARINRARANLEQAHAAAKLLDRAPFASQASIGGIKVLKSKNPFLPPLTRRGKAANPK